MKNKKMPFQKAVAQKNSDGSYTVRVIHQDGVSTDVVFPMDSENERLALEYTNFKNAQSKSGPKSPATQAVIADMKGMLNSDKHEQLMEQATLQPLTPSKKATGLEKWREEQRQKKLAQKSGEVQVPEGLDKT